MDAGRDIDVRFVINLNHYGQGPGCGTGVYVALVRLLTYEIQGGSLRALRRDSFVWGLCLVAYD